MSDEPHFLYVEDDMPSQRVLDVLLRRVMGFSQLTIFSTSENFMESVRNLPVFPDIIFLDIHMQPHDGYEMLAMLRQDPAFEATTIIAMTANVMSHDVENLRNAGFNGLIGKPVMKDVFPKLVEQIVAGESVWYVP